jgi:hypothetical protein
MQQGHIRLTDSASLAPCVISVAADRQPGIALPDYDSIVPCQAVELGRSAETASGIPHRTSEAFLFASLVQVLSTYG